MLNVGLSKCGLLDLLRHQARDPNVNFGPHILFELCQQRAELVGAQRFGTRILLACAKFDVFDLGGKQGCVAGSLVLQ